MLSEKRWTQEVYRSIIHTNTYREGATIVQYNWNTTDALSINFPLLDHTQRHPWPSVWEHPREKRFFIMSMLNLFLLCWQIDCKMLLVRLIYPVFVGMLNMTFHYTWHFIGFQEVLPHNLLALLISCSNLQLLCHHIHLFICYLVLVD